MPTPRPDCVSKVDTALASAHQPPLAPDERGIAEWFCASALEPDRIAGFIRAHRLLASLSGDMGELSDEERNFALGRLLGGASLADAKSALRSKRAKSVVEARKRSATPKSGPA